MKRKIKAGICRYVIIAALVASYLIVGGMEHFQIGIGAGVLGVVGCFAVGGLAAVVGCKEG